MRRHRFAEAVEIANDTDYGLTNYVQTTDNDKARRVARRLRSGMVEMNGLPRGAGRQSTRMKSG